MPNPRLGFASSQPPSGVSFHHHDLLFDIDYRFRLDPKLPIGLGPGVEELGDLVKAAVATRDAGGRLERLVLDLRMAEVGKRRPVSRRKRSVFPSDDLDVLL